jgi:sugar (pentulose or hexulose) kinase
VFVFGFVSELLSMSLYIGIDIGTSGVRACAIDDEEVEHGRASCKLPAPERQGPVVSQRAELWWDAVLLTLNDLFAQLDRRRVRAIAIDGTSGTLLLTDAHGTPLGPALAYNDTSTAEQLRRIEEAASTSSAARGAGSALAKLLLLQERYPGARHALHQADWLVGRLTSRYGFSDENNALKLGYDPVTRRWPDWLAALELRSELLPQVLVPGTPVGFVDARIAARLGLRRDVLGVAGTTDAVAGFLSTGADQIGDAVTSLGSTLVVKVLCAHPILAREYGVYSHRLGDAWLAGGASNTGGAALLKFFDRETMDALAPRLHPQCSTDLNYYPLPHDGERFPINDPNMPSRTSPRPDDDVRFFQGLLEGIASVERAAYRRLETLGAPYPTTVRTVGGGASNSAWTEIRARYLRVPVQSWSRRDAAYGTALLARRGAGQG